jgi:hypothetical protein
MELQNEKCVMVVDESLPLGRIANAAAIMEITLQYFGLAICGVKKKVNQLTGSLPLLR